MNSSHQNISKRVPYFPEDLGLRPDDEADLQLYVDSEGDYALGALLLNVRSIHDESLNRGRSISLDHSQFIDSLYVKIHERRKELGFPQ